MNREKIAVVSGYQETNNYISSEIKKLFGSEYETCAIYLGERFNEQVEKCKIIVCSSKFIADQVNYILKKNVPVVEARRNIDMNTIPDLLNIKSDSIVYVLGASEEGAEEIISILKEMGIQHLHLVPYYFQYTLGFDDIVISIAKIQTQNLNVRKVINIGYSSLTIYTAIEIFLKLGLPSHKLVDLLNSFKNDISATNQRTSLINKNMQGLLELVSEGILGVDDNNEVIFCNKHFSELTKIDSMSIIRKHIDNLSFHKNLADLIKNKHDIIYEVIGYFDKKLLVNKQRIPNSLNSFILSVQDVSQIQALENTVRKQLVKKGFVAKYTLDHLIGMSPIIKSKIKEAQKIANNDFNVIIEGDNGTGKEMFAQAIHNESKRNNQPFVAINIAALSDNLIESELFGYEEGSFTGALKGGKLGFFEMAHKGTLFIDEIGDISPFIQQRLLRVLQEREVMRVGGNRVIPVDVRIICATNKNLFKLVEDGLFRKDLYYRLKVLYINLPDLKERTSDIPLFLNYFFQSLKSSKTLTEEALDILKSYSWPGNVRELQNLVYYLESLCEKDLVSASDIPYYFKVKSDSNFVKNLDFDKVLASYDISILNDFEQILTFINSYNQQHILAGKDKLSYALTKSGHNLSPNQVRNRMIKLQNHELITIGSTKQGSKITQMGIDFLIYIKSNNI